MATEPGGVQTRSVGLESIDRKYMVDTLMSMIV
jgi:hypothetical protein